LRCVAGLAAPDWGTIRFNDADVTGAPARTRDVGVVFQNYALFPNLTAAANVAFPLEARGWPAPARRARIEELLDLVGLTEAADRYPHQLSGGQQQRIALIRALAARPQVLLLDEPLSALDALTRTALRDEIRRVQLKVGMTAIYVTHDQAEALAIADRVGVMARGRLVELGAPADVYLRPTSRFGAAFLGSRNTLTLIAGDDGWVRWGDGFAVPGAWPPGQRVVAAFTPESVELDAPEGVCGTIALVSFRGAMTHFRIATADGEIGVEIPSAIAGRFVAGAPTRVRVPADQVQVFREEAGEVEHDARP
jgi:putative spermidine/putrescine transport system ATP-binding protein